MKTIYNLVLLVLLIFPGILYADGIQYNNAPGTHKGVNYSSANIFSNESVLKEGEWLKLKISKGGIHKLTYDDLLAAGVNVENINPATLQIFGNGSGMLFERNSLPRYDGLNENAIFVAGEEDGIFNPGDYLLFYAESPTSWKYNPFKQVFEHETNLYDDHTYYFLTYNQMSGKRIETYDASGLVPNYSISSFQDYQHHELDLSCLLKTGKAWFGESLKDENEIAYSFEFPNMIMGESASLDLAYAVRSPDDSYLEVTAEGEQIADIELPSVHLESAQYALSAVKSLTFEQKDDQVDMHLKYIPYNNSSDFWIDYLVLNVFRELAFEGGQLSFCNPASVAPGRVSEFSVSNANENVRVWEITDKFNIREHVMSLGNDTWNFVVPTDSLNEFLAFDGSLFLTPEIAGWVENQNLHAFTPADLIIVTPPFLEIRANELGLIHQEADGLSYNLATTDQIYHEFSSGKLDPAAIRDFVRMLYFRAPENDRPRYLLLFGDGSYDPKDRHGENANHIPAFQSAESLKITYSFVTDDFYGLMDSLEGFDAMGEPDIGVGRIPVNSLEQSANAIHKIWSYIDNSNKNCGKWRNEIYFIADDEDGNTHVNQAEKLATIIDTGYNQYHVNKIYHDAYPQISLPGGDRYPEVTKLIKEAVDNGALIFNYTGHGGELGWSAEKVLDIPTVNAWENFDQMPVFVTATCEFSRFDNPEFESAGELVFLNPNGAGIALFTTTRLSYSSTNFALNRQFYLNAFERIEGEMPRLGDIIRLSKKVSNNFIKNFVLLGDPALRLAYPKYSVRTTMTEVDGIESSDTLSALSKVTVSGEIVDADGNVKNSFNGIIHPKVYDKFTRYKTLGNDNTSSPVAYDVQTKCLFEGRASVNEGVFDFSFIIPKDIDFKYGMGKIQYYAYDTVYFDDANGYRHITVGGINEEAIADNQGPAIELYLGNSDFKSGDVVAEDPILLANIHDPSGVNFFGNGIGHDLVMSIDGNPQMTYILNEYYETNLDDFTSGTIVFALNNLEPGSHTLEIKAWDVYNNSSTRSIEFIVGDQDDLFAGIANYPNPFSTSTVFEIDHRNLEGEIEYNLNVFSIDGKLVNSFWGTIDDGAGETTKFEWNGRDVHGSQLESGTYIYALNMKNEDGLRAVRSNKLLIIK